MREGNGCCAIVRACPKRSSMPRRDQEPWPPWRNRCATPRKESPMLKRFVDPRWIVALVLALNFGALGTHLWLGRSRGPLSIPRGTTLIPPVGRTAEGRDLGERDFAGRPCHVLRYESTRCSFCETDR